MANRSEPTIDVGALTEVVISAARRALEDRSAEEPDFLFLNQRFICGFIMEPPWHGLPPRGEGGTRGGTVVVEETEQ